MHRRIVQFHRLCESSRAVPVRLFYRQLAQVCEQMRRGLEQFSEGSPEPAAISVSSEITRLAPHLERECACLEREHRRIVDTVDSLIDQFRRLAASGLDDDCVVSLASLRFEECFREFEQVDEAETELLMRADGEDIGVGD